MSPVILLGLVVMWAVVLVPMWLKRHDEAEETRSVDRFTSAMHTLSRREPADKRYVVMPQRSRSVDVHVSGATAPSRRARRKALAARRKAARPPITAATRRRRTLLGLLIATVLTFVAAMLVGGLPLWLSQLLLDAVLVAIVVHLVLHGRHAAAGHRAVGVSDAAPAARAGQRPSGSARATRERPIAQPAAVQVETPVASAAVRREPLFDQTAPEVGFDQSASEVLVDQTATAGRVDERTSGVVFDQDVEVDLEPVAAAVEADRAVERPVDRPAAEQEYEIEIGGRPWEPVPVPPPTYTTKPTAPPRTPRAPIFEPLLPPSETAAELDPADDLEEILDRRWAVND